MMAPRRRSSFAMWSTNLRSDSETFLGVILPVAGTVVRSSPGDSPTEEWKP